jgi:hypothetical protein
VHRLAWTVIDGWVFHFLCETDGNIIASIHPSYPSIFFQVHVCIFSLRSSFFFKTIIPLQHDAKFESLNRMSMQVPKFPKDCNLRTRTPS